MIRYHALVILTLATSSLALAQSKRPQNLRECYLAALERTSADMAYMAQKLCEAAFKPVAPSLVHYNAQSKMCIEWWLDANGRYETADVYCAFERRADTEFVLACQDKAKATRFTVLDLVEKGERYERTGTAVGEDLGPLFKTLSSCLRHKAGS